MKNSVKYIQVLVFIGIGAGVLSSFYSVNSRQADYRAAQSLNTDLQSCLGKSAESQHLTRSGNISSLKINSARLLKVEKCFEELQSESMSRTLSTHLNEHLNALKVFHTDLIRYQSQESSVLKNALIKSFTELKNSDDFLKLSSTQNIKSRYAQTNLLTNHSMIFSYILSGFLVGLIFYSSSKRKLRKDQSVRYNRKTIVQKMDNIADRVIESGEEAGYYLKGDQVLSMDEALAEFEDEDDLNVPSLPISPREDNLKILNVSERYFNEAFKTILDEGVTLNIKSNIKDETLVKIDKLKLEPFCRYIFSEIDLIANNFSPYRKHNFFIKEAYGKVSFKLSSFFNEKEKGLEHVSQEDHKYTSNRLIICGESYSYKFKVLKDKRGYIHGMEYLFYLETKNERAENSSLS